VAVIGAGWAGLAAAVKATQAGHAVTLWEMAPQPGGRARCGYMAHGIAYDNGQHILIGAYRDTLALMRQVGVDPDRVLQRRPLALCYPDGRGLALPGGPPMLAFLRGVLSMPGYTLGERLGLLRIAGGWLLRGFRCDPTWSVATLCAGLPARIHRDLIEPLCVAALNTPAESASAAVLLRVLHDALFAVRGGSDLLLPRRDLSALLPQPALQWLRSRGARVLLGRRIGALERGSPAGWQVDGQTVDAVILAAGPQESARLAEAHAPGWARLVRALPFEPIATVYAPLPGPLKAPGEPGRAGPLALPMTALDADASRPAQYVFDLDALRGEAGAGLAFVISGAAPWVAQGRDALAAAVVAQAHEALGLRLDAAAPGFRVVVEKRATFLCRPGLERPGLTIAPGLLAAGDHVAGPYPSTLEGAVRSGLHAAGALPGAPRGP
jgi:squalene-associated FAD-dependent desaturase